MGAQLNQLKNLTLNQNNQQPFSPIAEANNQTTATTPLVNQLLQLQQQQQTPPQSLTSPSVTTPSALSPFKFTTPSSGPSNPFDSNLVSNGLSLTMQQLMQAQTPKATTTNGNGNQDAFGSLNGPNTTSLDLTSPRNALGALAVLRSSSMDSTHSLSSIPGLPPATNNNVNIATTPKQQSGNNAFNTPIHNPFGTPINGFGGIPKLPRLQSTTSLGSVLSFRGLSDPMTNLVNGSLPRMDSTGLFMQGLNKIMRESSIPQTPTTPNITRNLSEISMLSNQGNSHFVPYNATNSEYFAPPTPSKSDKNKKNKNDDDDDKDAEEEE